MVLAWRHDRTPMDDSPLTEEELAREHRSEALVALYDGWGQAHGMPPMTFGRRLDAFEQASWREGHAVGVAERREAARVQAQIDAVVNTARTALSRRTKTQKD